MKLPSLTSYPSGLHYLKKSIINLPGLLLQEYWLRRFQVDQCTDNVTWSYQYSIRMIFNSYRMLHYVLNLMFFHDWQPFQNLSKHRSEDVPQEATLNLNRLSRRIRYAKLVLHWGKVMVTKVEAFPLQRNSIPQWNHGCKVLFGSLSLRTILMFDLGLI